jgi:YidC/Oxa1 family membrane protein insertase
MFSVEQTVQNDGATPVALAPYGQIARHGEPPNLKGFFILHEGMVRMSDGELNETKYGNMPEFDINPKERAPADVVQVAEGGWIGFTDHYWMTTIVPQGAFKSVAKYDTNNDVYLTEAVQPTQTIEAGASTTVTSQFFAGREGMGSDPQLPKRQGCGSLRRQHRLGLVLFLDQTHILAAAYDERFHRQYGLVDHLLDFGDQSAAFAPGL